MKADERMMGLLSAIFAITRPMDLSGVFTEILPELGLPLKQFTDEFRRVTEAELRTWEKQQTESN